MIRVLNFKRLLGGGGTWKALALGSAVTLMTIGAGTGIAVATGVTLPFSGDGNTINGCYSPGGQLMVLTPVQKTCPTGMTPIH